MKAPDWLLLGYGSTTSQFARGSTRCCINTASQDGSSWSDPKDSNCPDRPGGLGQGRTRHFDSQNVNVCDLDLTIGGCDELRR